MAGDTDFSWLQLFGAALGGGLTVKVIDILYQEVRRRQDKTLTATKFVDEHLDPLLKAADEVVGKLHSLATSDFKPLSGAEMDLNPITSNDFGSLLYLISRFWARMEIIKQEGLSVAITNDRRGALLQSFFACLESRKVRIVDRISQRAIGEILIKPAPDYLRNIGYVEFIRALETNDDTRRWISPLATALGRVTDLKERQQLLLYGTVVHAMIDTLDPKHAVTSSRPSYPIKLSDKTRKNLKYRVFGVYLKFVANKEKYLVWGGPEKG
ncbi:MAG: hypothetical protein U1E61_14185 [Bradyrhizobium sp.]